MLDRSKRESARFYDVDDEPGSPPFADVFGAFPLDEGTRSVGVAGSEVERDNRPRAIPSDLEPVDLPVPEDERGSARAANEHH